jgi:uncharacterized protein (DUF2336 family)
MSTRASLIEELESTIRSESSDRLSDTLQRVTSLFVSSASQLDEQHVDVFDDVMSRLIDQIETRALAELSQKLAPITNAPIAVVGHLARNDEISVAGPVLSASPRLTRSDLIAIAEIKSQAHLWAISQRVQIDPPVTDVLVRRGDTDVLREVAGNTGANFSPNGFELLAERADDDQAITGRILLRRDVPPHLFCNLLVKAKETVRQHLLKAASDTLQAEIHRVVDKISGEIADDIIAKPDYGTVIHRLMSRHKDGKLTDQDVAQYAQAGQFEETVAALSLLSSVPTDMVERLITGKRLEPTLILCKAINLQWPTVRGIIQAFHHSRDNMQDVMTDACEDYGKLAQASAQKVLLFWLKHGFVGAP